MILLKILFCILLCCPIAYIAVVLYRKLVYNAMKKH